MDIEEQLDLFFIRKENEENLAGHKNSEQANYSKNVLNCIPLMLKHVKSLNENWKDTSVIKIFSEKVQFKNCLVYGKIMGKQKESKSNSVYILDDGTASLNIILFKKTNDMKTIFEIENELQSIRREMSAQNKNETVDSLRNLLFKAKEQIDNQISLGSNVLLYGKPTCYRGQVSFKVYCYIQDEKCNRDIEISFKDYLINWYKSNCMFLTNC